jgi:excisionase family DNA binding protein
VQLPERTLTAPEMARVLRLPLSTVYELARTGTIPCMRISPRRIRFDHHQVLHALQREEAA